MSLHDNMREFYEARSSASADELATLFIKQVTKADLLPLLAMEFWRVQRAEIRQIESKAAAQLAAGHHLGDARVVRLAGYGHDLDALRDLLDKPYRARGTEEQLFRYMTREEHQARIDMLMAHRAGVTRSIELHQSAIRLIDATGVTCIDDLDRDLAA